jgi:hypothetical protein
MCLWGSTVAAPSISHNVSMFSLSAETIQVSSVAMHHVRNVEQVVELGGDTISINSCEFTVKGNQDCQVGHMSMLAMRMGIV